MLIRLVAWTGTVWYDGTRSALVRYATYHLSMQPSSQIEQLLKALERFKTNADMTGG